MRILGGKRFLTDQAGKIAQWYKEHDRCLCMMVAPRWRGAHDGPPSSDYRWDERCRSREDWKLLRDEQICRGPRDLSIRASGIQDRPKHTVRQPKCGQAKCDHRAIPHAIQGSTAPPNVKIWSIPQVPPSLTDYSSLQQTELSHIQPALAHTLSVFFSRPKLQPRRLTPYVLKSQLGGRKEMWEI